MLDEGDQKINIALRSKIFPENRSEDSHLLYLPSTAEVFDLLLGYLDFGWHK